MTNRIRYKNTNEENILESVRRYRGRSAGEFSVRLNITEMTFDIYDHVAEMVAMSGKAPTLHKLKIEAKEALALLGVPFDREDRVGKHKGGVIDLPEVRPNE